jgi:signal transduction histidine kinase
MPVSARWGNYTTEHRLKAGEYVFREGEPGDVLYIVASGNIAIIKDAGTGSALVLGYRGTGEMVGEVSLITEAARTASVMAIEPTTLLAIPRTEFWRLVDQDADFRRTVMQALIDRLLVADESRLRAAAQEKDLFERLASLSTEHERLAEIVQLRQETLQFIVHDLRNPLSLVTTSLGMMEMDPSYDPDSEMGTFIIIARRGLERMLALVDALLDVERLDRGAAALSHDRFDLCALLHQVVERVRPMASITGVGVELSVPDAGLPVITADLQRIDRVIQNLIDNAMKYTAPGKALRVSVWQQGTQVLVAVDDQDRAFHPSIGRECSRALPRPMHHRTVVGDSVWVWHTAVRRLPPMAVKSGSKTRLTGRGRGLSSRCRLSLRMPEFLGAARQSQVSIVFSASLC